jgi:D-alanine--poly(phosphoribitol) ligase subunit 1
MTARGVLGAALDHADQAPDRPAVKDLDRALTRGELRAAAGRVAAGLLQKGVEPGEAAPPTDRRPYGTSR